MDLIGEFYKTFVLGDDSRLQLGTQELSDQRGELATSDSLGRSRTPGQ